MRAPKTLDQYIPFEEAAAALEDLALNLRRNALHRPLVKWTITLNYWNPAWLDKTQHFDHIVTQVSYMPHSRVSPPRKARAFQKGCSHDERPRSGLGRPLTD